MAGTVDLTIGVLEIGTFFSTALYGIIVVQFYLYLTGQHRDPLWLRIMVWAIWILETAHTILLWTSMYRLTVTFYGKPKAIITDTLPLSISFPFAGVIGSAVQSFFAYRVHVISGRWLIPTIAWIAAVARTAFSILLCIEPLKFPDIKSFLHHRLWVAIAPLGVGVINDVITTTSLCYYLLRERSAFKSSQTVIDRLVMYTIETGLITAIFGVAVVVTAAVSPLTYLDLGVAVIYPKLFSNSLFASLNARHSLRQLSAKRAPTYATSASFGRSLLEHEGAVTLELSPRSPPENRAGMHMKASAMDPDVKDFVERRTGPQAV